MSINPYLRMQNLYQLGAPVQEGVFPDPNISPPDFGAPNPQQFQTQVDMRSMAPPEDDIVQRYMQMYKPETAYSAKLEELINQYPQEPKHTFKQRLLASIMGIGQGGIQRADKVLHGEYEGQIQDWKNKLQPYEYLAGTERYNNANQRQLITQMAGRDIQADRADTYRLYTEGRLADADVRNKIAQQRADAYEWRIKNPNHQLKDVGGSLVNFDPATGQGGPVLDSTGQPIKTGSLSERDKHNLRMDEIRLRNQGAMDRTIAAGADVYTETDPTTGEEKNTVFNPRAPKATPPRGPLKKVGTPGSSYESEGQKEIRDYRKAMDALRRHPEWAPYIKKGQGAHDWSLVPPKGWRVTEKEKQDYEAAKKAVLEPEPSLSNPTQPITVPGSTPPNVPAGSPMSVGANYTETVENGVRVRNYRNGRKAYLVDGQWKGQP